MTPVTVRCGRCGSKIGEAITQPDPSMAEYAPEVLLVASRVVDRRRRGGQRPDRAGESREPLPLAGPGGHWNKTRFPVPVPCPSRECKANYLLGAIAARVAEARRRGVGSIKVHHTAPPNE